jgi:hypothetical protein
MSVKNYGARHRHGTALRKSSQPIIWRASTSHPIRMLGHGTVTVTARHVRTVSFSHMQSYEISPNIYTKISIPRC